MMRAVSFASMLLTACFAGTAAAQSVTDLVAVDSANRSATGEVTRSIAAYIARQNDATIVQVLSRPQPEAAGPMGLADLLDTIRTDAVLRSAAGPGPAAIAPTPPATEPAETSPPARRQLRDRNPFGGGADGGGGGGGAGGGGGGGW